MSALLEIHERLVQSGLTEDEADALIAKFLREEAEAYVAAMKPVIENLKEAK